ncbi:hypothetical protein C8J56DRAFT_1054249 [Mycena floridula]|nr:hypothetical protein C8J56DRAFT_1054249 [Mycena floridula]
MYEKVLTTQWSRLLPLGGQHLHHRVVHRCTTGDHPPTPNDDDPPVKDVISISLQALTDSSTNPLDEYNSAFRCLKIRRQRVTPIVGPGSGSYSTESLDQVSSNNSNHPLVNQGSAPLSDSPILASANLASPPGSDSEESEEEEGEFERIMAEDDDPTLRCENAEDVSLDMDDEDCGEADDSDSDSDED